MLRLLLIVPLLFTLTSLGYAAGNLDPADRQFLLDLAQDIKDHQAQPDGLSKDQATLLQLLFDDVKKRRANRLQESRDYSKPFWITKQWGGHLRYNVHNEERNIVRRSFEAVFGGIFTLVPIALDAALFCTVLHPLYMRAVGKLSEKHFKEQYKDPDVLAVKKLANEIAGAEGSNTAMIRRFTGYMNKSLPAGRHVTTDEAVHHLMEELDVRGRELTRSKVTEDERELYKKMKGYNHKSSFLFQDYQLAPLGLKMLAKIVAKRVP